MADGTIRFDTEINNSKMEKALNNILKSIQAFSGNSSKAFKELDESADKISDTMSKVADSVNQVSAGDMEKLVKQWDNLNAQIEVQQKLLDSLREKYERVSNLKGPDSEEALKLQKNILKAEEALDKMIDKSDKYAEKAQKMDEASSKAASSISKAGSQASSAAGDIDKVGAAASSADGDLDKLASSASEAGEALGGISGNADGAASGLDQFAQASQSVSGGGQGASNAINLLFQGLQMLPGATGSAASGITSLVSGLGGASTSAAAMAGVVGGAAVAAVVALASAINSLFEKTEEMREGFATLQVNAENMGVSMETVRTGMEEFNVVSEDFNANTEAMSNLLAAGFEDSNMAEIVERLSDAVIKFPDTLKIESLADSLQETIATKEAVGQFGELLGRVGVNVEEFNQGLKDAAQSGKEQEYVLKTLSQTDLPGLTAAYKENNKAMVEAKQSQYEFDEAMAELANELAPLKYGFDNLVNSIKTGFIKVITEAIKGVKDLINSLKELFDQQQKNSQQSLNNSMRPSDSGILALSASPAAPVFARAQPRAQVMSFAGGEQVMTAPATNTLLSMARNSFGEGSSILGNVSGGEDTLSQIMDAIRLLGNSNVTINNDIEANITVQIDSFDGFMDVFSGLMNWQTSVRQGWTGGF